jgi:hypothetical protein
MGRLMTARNAKPDKASFTGRKLDWLRCVAFDPWLTPIDFEVAFAIAQHENQSTGQCNPSDARIAAEIGCDPRTVRRARHRLRETGWLDWKRTRATNQYRLIHDYVESTLILIKTMHNARRKPRNAAGMADTAKPVDRTQMSHLGSSR